MRLLSRPLARYLRATLLVPLGAGAIVLSITAGAALRIDAEHERAVAAALDKADAWAVRLAERTQRLLRQADLTTRLVGLVAREHGTAGLDRLLAQSQLPVLVTDAAGRVVARSPGLAASTDLSSHEDFRAHRDARDPDGAVRVGRTLASGPAGEATVLLSRRLDDASGRFAGMVALAMAPAAWVDGFATSELGPGGSLALVGTDGLYRVRKIDGRVDFGEAADGLTRKALAAGDTRSLAASRAGVEAASVDSDDVPRYLRHRRVEGHPLVVAAGVSQRAALAEFHAWRRGFVGQAVLAALAVVLVAGVLSHQVLRLRRLHATAERARRNYEAAAQAARRLEQERERERAFLRTLLDNLPLGVAVRSARPGRLGEALYANEAARRIHGTGDEPAEAPITLTALDPDPAAIAERDQRVFAEGRPVRFADVPFDGPAGRRYLTLTKVPVHDAETGSPDCLLVLTEDVTDRQATRNQLRLAHQVLEQTEEAILVTDEDDAVLMANPAFYRLSGLDEPRVLGQRAARLGLTPRSLLLAPDAGGMRDRWAGQTVQQAADGREIPCWMSLRQWPADDGRTLTIRVWSDITPLKEAQAKLERLALYDSLTGLPNRAHFHSRLEHAVERARRARHALAVCFIDLDDFKTVNDTLGHDAGDALLIEIGRRLSSLVRASDTVCRLGGDEFTIIAEALKVPEDASALCERILATLAEPIVVAGRAVRACVSIGVCIYPDDGADVAQLLKSADLAMYRVKELGKNGYQFFSKALAEAAVARIELERQLRAAVRDGQLELAYLPKVDLRTRRAVGLEALLRWRRPQRGIELPAGFLDVAERSDLILELGDWVIDSACAQLAAWRDAGLTPLPVAVNVSARQVQRGDLAAHIAAALTRHRVDPQLLQVDLTERAMLIDVPRARSLLEQLAVMGVHVAIDDFGSGDATLARLGELPIGSLKIDRSLVSAATRDDAGRAAFESTVALAREMGFRAVAEGIENDGQLQLALRFGVEEAQGYRFGQPGPAETVRRLLRAGGDGALEAEQRDPLTAELPFE